MLCSGVLHAVDGSRSTDEYLRRSWGTEQGLSDGRVNAIAQTPDGYLWVGTDRDLLRFDGKHFTSTQPPAGTIDPIAHVLSLNVDRQGVLWIRTSESRLLTYSGGKFVEVMSPAQGEPAVTSATPSNTSGLLATGIWHGLMQLSSGSYRINPLPTDHLYVSIAQTTDNRIWLGTRESGLILWQNGALTPVTEGIPDSKINCLLAAKDATLWVGTDNGLALWDGHSAKPVALSSGMNKLPILAMIQDRNGNLWLGTSRGLVRYNSSGAQWLTGDANDQETAITALLEDREGDIWFGNDQKLERLEDSPFITYGDAKQLREDRYGAVYVDTRGYVWLAPLSGGLDWVAKGVVHRMLKDGLDKDVVYSLDGQADDIWVGRQKGGLTHLHWTGQSFDAKTWNRTDGLPENTIYTVRVVRDGSVWVGTLTGGASHIFNGHVETLNEHSGLPSNTVSDIEEDSKGAMWFATSNGVSELRPNSHLLSGPPDQLSSANALVLEHDSEGGVWIGTTSGLAYINDGHVRRFAMQELAESAILGLMFSAFRGPRCSRELAVTPS
jgi:ligand-binding sensor domain-containing protein